MSARTIIGRTADHRGLRTPRTLTEAFGPHASYAGIERAHRTGRIDRIVGRACLAALAGTVLALLSGVL